MTSIILLLSACQSGNNQQGGNTSGDSTGLIQNDKGLDSSSRSSDTSNINKTAKMNSSENKKTYSTVFIYNFHVTNRCPSCIAIEEATTKTLNTYFLSEVKNGRIKRQILNVDDAKNEKISEKYQVFGSGLFVIRSFKGKETIADLTGDGFKYARNKKDKFIEVLKNKITEYLK